MQCLDAFGGFADDYDLLQIAQILSRNCLYLRVQRCCHHRDARPAIVQDVLVLCGLQQGIQGNRNSPDLDAAKKTIKEFGSVEQQERDPLFPPDAKLLQDIAEAVDPLHELRIGDLLVAAFDGDLCSTAFAQMAVDKMACRIEFGGKVNGSHRG